MSLIEGIDMSYRAILHDVVEWNYSHWVYYQNYQEVEKETKLEKKSNSTLF